MGRLQTQKAEHWRSQHLSAMNGRTARLDIGRLHLRSSYPERNYPWTMKLRKLTVNLDQLMQAGQFGEAVTPLEMVSNEER
jgi:hypothetical protein